MLRSLNTSSFLYFLDEQTPRPCCRTGRLHIHFHEQTLTHSSVSIQEIQMTEFRPGNVPVASLHLLVGLQGSFSIVCAFGINKMSTYYAQSTVQRLMRTEEGRLRFKPK